MGFTRTLTLYVGRKLNGHSQEEKSAAIVAQFAPLKVESVQFCFEVVRVTFATAEMKAEALREKGFHMFGMWIKIEGGGPPLTNVHIFDYPFEGDDGPVKDALSGHGEVKEVRQQRYSFNPDLFSGTRIVRMVLEDTPPRMLLIGGYLCRLWYRGQPLICHICKEEGHRAANCPGRDKCRLCKQPGHIARHCPNPWGVAVDDGEVVGVGDDPAPMDVSVSAPAVGDDPAPESDGFFLPSSPSGGGFVLPPVGGAVSPPPPGSPPKMSAGLVDQILAEVSFSPVSVASSASTDSLGFPESVPLAAALPAVSPPPPGTLEVSPADPPAAQPVGEFCLEMECEPGSPVVLGDPVVVVLEESSGAPVVPLTPVDAVSPPDSVLVRADGGAPGGVCPPPVCVGSVGPVSAPVGAPVGGKRGQVPGPKKIAFKHGGCKDPPLPKRVLHNLLHVGDFPRPATRTGEALQAVHLLKSPPKGGFVDALVRNVVCDNVEMEIENELLNNEMNNDMNNVVTPEVTNEMDNQMKVVTELSIVDDNSNVHTGSQSAAVGGGASHAVCRMLSSGAALCARPPSSLSSPPLSSGAAGGVGEEPVASVPAPP